MTDAEIIKALECCGEHKRLCNECSYRYTLPERCDIDMFHDAVALINRQKAEIDILIRKKDTLRDEIAEQQAEIERLQEEIGSLNKSYPCTVKMNDYCLVYARSLEDYDNLIGDISAEGIKEFWDRMRTEIDDSRYKVITDTHYARGCNDVIDYCIVKGDNLVKEMTEQKE